MEEKKLAFSFPKTMTSQNDSTFWNLDKLDAFSQMAQLSFVNPLENFVTNTHLAWIGRCPNKI